MGAKWQPVFERILITGIPGAGKTTMGEYLVQRHGFEHLDFELPGPIDQFLRAGEDGLLEELGKLRAYERLVVSWGFLPEAHLGHVLLLRENSWTWIWLDGDRAAARRAFLARGTSTELQFDLQMRAIEHFVELVRLQPRIVDPFDGAGDFRAPADIAADILRDPAVI